MNLEQLQAELSPVARRAGEAIMAIHAAGTQVEYKGDGSPVSAADRAAEAIILPELARLAPQIAVISEENAASHKLAPPRRFFLVDPLDGTKEFLKGCGPSGGPGGSPGGGKGGFTVNIALIEDGAPRMGVVYAPALDRLFTGVVGVGASESGVPIAIRDVPEDGPVAVASSSHRDAQTDAWLLAHGIQRTVSIGSSLKFCLLAAGEADVYPRFGPTMEWDTAAGDAVLRAAGGRLETPQGETFRYAKPDYRNGAFIARGGF